MTVDGNSGCSWGVWIVDRCTRLITDGFDQMREDHLRAVSHFQGYPRRVLALSGTAGAERMAHDVCLPPFALPQFRKTLRPPLRGSVLFAHVFKG